MGNKNDFFGNSRIINDETYISYFLIKSKKMKKKGKRNFKFGIITIHTYYTYFWSDEWYMTDTL